MSAFSSAPLTLVADADPSHIALEALPQLDGTGNEPLVPHVNLLAPQGPLMEPLVGSHSLAPLVQEGDNLPCSMVVQHHFSSGREGAPVEASVTDRLASAASVVDDVFADLSTLCPPPPSVFPLTPAVHSGEIGLAAASAPLDAVRTVDASVPMPSVSPPPPTPAAAAATTDKRF